MPVRFFAFLLAFLSVLSSQAAQAATTYTGYQAAYKNGGATNSDWMKTFGNRFEVCKSYWFKDQATVVRCLNSATGSDWSSTGRSYVGFTYAQLQATGCTAGYGNGPSGLYTTGSSSCLVEMLLPSVKVTNIGGCNDNNNSNFSAQIPAGAGRISGPNGVATTSVAQTYSSSYGCVNVNTTLTTPPENDPPVPQSCTYKSKGWNPGNSTFIYVQVLAGKRFINPGDYWSPEENAACRFRVFFCMSFEVNGYTTCYMTAVGQGRQAGDKTGKEDLADAAYVKDQLNKILNEKKVPPAVPYGTPAQNGKITADTDSCALEDAGYVEGDCMAGGQASVPVKVERDWNEKTPYFHPQPDNLVRDQGSASSCAKQYNPNCAWSPSTTPANQLTPDRLVSINPATNRPEYVPQPTPSTIVMPPQNPPMTGTPSAGSGGDTNPDGTDIDVPDGDGEGSDPAKYGKGCDPDAVEKCGKGAKTAKEIYTESGLEGVLGGETDTLAGSMVKTGAMCSAERYGDSDICKTFAALFVLDRTTSGDVGTSGDVTYFGSVTHVELIPEWVWEFISYCLVFYSYYRGFWIILGRD